MANYQERLKALVVKLHEINVLKFGNFKMKIGVESPVYFDLRIIVSHPKTLMELSELICEFAKTSLESCDHLCGVPYAALSIATLVSVKSNKSMLIRRKEAKDYGTKRLVEGCYKDGQSCIIIEDVVTSGLSIIETVQDLEGAGLTVNEAIVVVDREQGGSQHLASQNIKMRSLITLSEIMVILKDAGKITEDTVQSVKEYIKSRFVTIPIEKLSPSLALEKRLKMKFEERAIKAKNPVSARLLQLMAEKQTTLCVAADFTSASKVLEIASAVGPYICLLKTHVDALFDYSKDFVKELQQLALVHNFMIMEDRKFSDIGHTVSLQYASGPFHVAEWADLVTTHVLPGPGIIDGLIASLETLKPTDHNRACFVVIEMSSEGTLTSGSYRTAAVKIAESRPDFVAGVVSQSAIGLSLPGLIQLTPGVKITSSNGSANGKGDGLGQQYNSPSAAVIEKGADIAVVGRGITEAENPIDMAKTYRDLLWDAYIKRASS